MILKLSSKLQFAIKVSLSLTLAYMIPMAMGWSQPNTAAMTVMLIASAGEVSDGFNKGMIRVIGTVIGAIIGVILIGLFPQERMLYLISMSIIVSILTYLYYAYQGDSTALMLSAMMVMMIFLNGAENAFLYGVDRTYMTLFGILMYTLIGVFLWPVKADPELINDAPRGRMFVWLDPEYFKATLQLFFVFWFSVAFWIYFNPPSGFMVVMLASLIGLLTAFSPIKPSLLVLLFSFGFVFALFAYIAVLPNLVYGWQLALFIFAYTFIGFYFINADITIMFLLGMFTLGIGNEMHYNFDIFLMILLSFYMFLIILMFFYNFPFSSRPEHLFTLMKERFVKHSEALEKIQKDEQEKSFFKNLVYNYHKAQLDSSVKKMQVWAPKVDTKYFLHNTPELIEAFSKSCLNYLKQETQLTNCYSAMEKIDWQNLKVNRF